MKKARQVKLEHFLGETVVKRGNILFKGIIYDFFHGKMSVQERE
jgi:hypothetical protein